MLAFDTNNYNEAIPYLEKVYEVDPKNNEVVNCLAQSYFFIGNKTKALKYAKDGLLLDSGVFSNTYVYAYFLSVFSLLYLIYKTVRQYNWLNHCHRV